MIETKTINLLNSDHYTTTVKIKIPAIAYISENRFKDSPKTRISLENVMEDLDGLPQNSEDISSLISSLDEILKPGNNKNHIK